MRASVLVFPLILFLLSAVFADPLFDTIPKNLCDYVSYFSYSNKSIVNCSADYTKLAFRLVVAFGLGLIYFLVYCAYMFVSFLKKDRFSPILRDVKNYYYFLNETVPFLSKRAFDEAAMNSVLRHLQNIFAYHLGSNQISISIFLATNNEKTPTSNVEMSQKLIVERNGTCTVPPFAHSFPIGKGFVGLSWRFRQIRMGRKKYFLWIYNKAFVNFENQDDKNINSIFTIPIVLDGEGVIFAVISIDSSKARHFGYFASRHESYKELGPIVAKIVGLYLIRVYGIDSDILAKLGEMEKDI